MRYNILFALIITISILANCGLSSNSVSSSNNVRIENVTSDTSHPNVGYVKGMVRNLSNNDIKGAVKIKFLNFNGDVVHSSRAYVNDGDPIRPGKSASFSYATEPEYFTGVEDFEITFYER